MQKVTDWATLWKELVEIKRDIQKDSIETPGDTDYWESRALAYDDRVKEKWSKPDSTRKFMLSTLEPHTSLIDIGAGTGAWSILFSKRLDRITAIEPSRAMREVLKSKISREGINNIEVLAQKWPNCTPDPHDYVFCSHAMYGTADLPEFINKMNDRSRKMCFLLIRAPSSDGLITEAFQHIWQQPHDSPNFTIAYNILLQMGIFANVLFEESEKKHFLASASEKEAFVELKRRLGLLDTDKYDTYLIDLLQRRLVEQDGQFLWPGSVRSALIYWEAKH